jgi:Tol biopolymer transport system component
VFVLERATGEIALAFETAAGRAGEAHFSPDGRWITLEVRDHDRATNTLHLYGLERGTTTEYRSILPLNGGYDWSADGRWLVKTDNYYLSLIVPETGYHDIFVYDPQMTCYLAAWIDRVPAE